MFSAPGNDGLHAEGWSGDDLGGDRIQELMKSALNDVKSK